MKLSLLFASKEKSWVSITLGASAIIDMIAFLYPV